MARIIVIGGIESTYHNAQILHDIGEDIVMFYTRGPRSPGWEGVDIVDEAAFRFANKVPQTIVNGNINDHVDEMKALRPHVIYSFGWQQIYSRSLLAVCPVIGLHESLLPEGAGAVPIANAILHGAHKTGCTLFWLDEGVDTGAIIGQLVGLLDPRNAIATQLYEEAIHLSSDLLKMYVPQINSGKAPSIPQDMSRRTAYKKINWHEWSDELVRRTKVYPYV